MIALDVIYTNIINTKIKKNRNIFFQIIQNHKIVVSALYITKRSTIVLSFLKEGSCFESPFKITTLKQLENYLQSFEIKLVKTEKASQNKLLYFLTEDEIDLISVTRELKTLNKKITKLTINDLCKLSQIIVFKEDFMTSFNSKTNTALRFLEFLEERKLAITKNKIADIVSKFE